MINAFFAKLVEWFCVVNQSAVTLDKSFDGKLVKLKQCGFNRRKTSIRANAK